jgi:hypothetical protein
MEMNNTFDHDLCDEILAAIISFLDFQSAVIFTTRTSRRLEKRILSLETTTETTTTTARMMTTKHGSRCFDELWREIFRRHLFCPVECLSDACVVDSTGNDHDDDREIENDRRMLHGIDYIQHCYYRLALLDNLTHEQRCLDDAQNHIHGKKQSTRRKHFKLCSSFPDRCFHFLPVTPTSSPANTIPHHTDETEDMPSVDFPCSSYLLTSPGVEGEYVFLNPFDGEVAVFRDILQNARNARTQETKENILDDMHSHPISTFSSQENGSHDHNHDEMIVEKVWDKEV